ncbi:T9SS type A sorting domain-containing protein [Adhaeribacter soli]|uniref:T9SS type A sorting domain-containing protein n=1 Tax=Adhaeribacter soli TaxID=2607655 RepID=A0A5N1J4E1_9BACT|nr:T9SS type A sorting domain-containing protein [Adhaeribacter soli]KAA9340945.1 T9SS type A sorting domain-containing protein [Adhaeribacter soli]
MKIKFTFCQNWQAFLAFIILNGFLLTKVVAQTMTTISKPGSSQDFDHNGTNWVHVANSTYTYDSHGNQLTKLSLDPNTNENISKNEMTYHVSGEPSSNLSYQWQNNSWVVTHGWKDTLIFDTNNRVVIRIKKDIQNGIWEVRKTEYNYDVNGNKVEEIGSTLVNGNWNLSNRRSYSWANGLITEVQHDVPGGANWQKMEKYVYASWHLANVNPASYIRYIYDRATNQWSPGSRNTISLTGNGGSIYTVELNQNNAWVNYYRINEYYDSKGNYTGYLKEIYAGGWEPEAENQVLITYNSLFEITSMTYRWPQIVGGQMTGPVVDQYKYVYSNFQYFQRALGTNENQKATPAFNVFPNPAQNIINITSSEKSPATTATLSDLTGKTWLTQKFNANEPKQLNIEALPKGIYLLQLKTAKGTSVQKIIKQ